MTQGAIFFDRDATLIEDKHYIVEDIIKKKVKKKATT